MIPLSSYHEYEEKLFNQLKEILSSELGTTVDNIKTHYRYVKKDGTTYEFDLVVLEKNSIKFLYEIRSYNAVNRNYNFIKSQLQLYKEATSAEEVYLVYSTEDSYLERMPLSKLQKKKKCDIKYTIDNFSAFYERLSKNIFTDENDELEYFFRGHADCTFEPSPSVLRDKNYMKYEHTLYFACKEEKEKDGEVLIFPMLGEQIHYNDSDEVRILANLAKQPAEFVFSRDNKHLLYDIQKDNPHFKEQYLKSETINQIICVKPKFNNERILRQQGAFLIFGLDNSKEKPAEFTDSIIRIRILAESKDAILRDLNVFGINEAALFPETDKIMNQIKHEFDNRSRQK